MKLEPQQIADLACIIINMMRFFPDEEVKSQELIDDSLEDIKMEPWEVYLSEQINKNPNLPNYEEFNSNYDYGHILELLIEYYDPTKKDDK